MKKLLYLTLLMLCMSILISAGETKAASVMEPQWGEFCPPMYESAIFRKEDKPGKYNENNYWAVRRVKFEKSVLECKNISKTQDELNACYARVASIEKNKTAQRTIARNEKRENTYDAIYDSGTGYGNHYYYHFGW